MFGGRLYHCLSGSISVYSRGSMSFLFVGCSPSGSHLGCNERLAVR